jgi:hypothetical protein
MVAGVEARRMYVVRIKKEVKIVICFPFAHLRKASSSSWESGVLLEGLQNTPNYLPCI